MGRVPALLATLVALAAVAGCSRADVARFGRLDTLAGETAPRPVDPALLNDPRIEQAPMDEESKRFAREFFAKPDQKVFAFSPEKGVNRHAWGAESIRAARRTAVEQCEAYSGTRCVVFAVNDRIVWQPDGQPTSSPAAAASTPAQAAARATPGPAPAGEAPPTPGASAYLVGLFDTRDGRATLLEVANPTGADLRLFMAFYDDQGAPLLCHRETLAGGDLVEVDVAGVGVSAPRGTVRVVALAPDEVRPREGVVGLRRLTIGRQPLSEAALLPVQERLLEAELPGIGRLCRW